MPHYKDGTPAKVGDLVKGTTYNVKGEDGRPRVLVGTLLQIAPNTEACNCVLGYVEQYAADMPGGLAGISFRDSDGKSTLLVPRTDYGETRAFDLVHRPGSEQPAAQSVSGAGGIESREEVGTV